MGQARGVPEIENVEQEVGVGWGVEVGRGQDVALCYEC